MVASCLVKEFENKFNSQPALLVKCPGRINLIGEHTDYNNGLVLPIAINKYTYFAINRSTHSHHRIFTLNLNEGCEIPINSFEKRLPK